MPLFSGSLRAESDEQLPAAPGEAEAHAPTRYTIGELLRDARKSCGGDIDHIAAALCIRPSYLVAIEESRYAKLPGPVYAQGFVRAYAVHLGFDGEEAVRRFKQEVTDLDVAQDLSFPVPLAERSIPGGTMLVAALILALCGYGVWYYISTGNRTPPDRVSAVPADLLSAASAGKKPAPSLSTRAASPAAAGSVSATSAAESAASTTAPSSLAAVSRAARGAPAPLPTARATAPAPPSPAAASAPAPARASAAATRRAASRGHVFGAPANVPVRIVVHAIEDSWVELRDGDKILVERILHPGDRLRIPDEPGLSLRTGNGAGLEFEVDGKLGKPLSGTVRTIALNPARLVH